MGFILVFVVGALLSQANCHPDGNRQSVGKDIGGHQIPIQSAPYVVSIYQDASDGLYTFTCAASIIHEQFVLTAAECCTHPKRIEEYIILVGTDKYEEAEETDGQFLEIEEIIVHEKYDYSDFNVCLIKLKEPLDFGPEIGKIDIAKTGFNLSGGAALNATGWEQVMNPDNSQILYQVEIPLVAKKTCKKEWGSRFMDITQRMICAGGAGYDYPTSAGNPLVLSDVNIQVGVSTLQTDISAGLPAIYTRVASMAAWIDRKIQQFE